MEKKEIKMEVEKGSESKPENKTVQQNPAPKKTELEIEVNGEWVNAKKASLGTCITGARFNTSETRVKTENGWFDETDPEKAPVIMVETADRSIKLSGHVKGGEWLPLDGGRTGCNIPMDGLTFVE